MKISLNQWNQICEALELAETVKHAEAKALREKGQQHDAFRVEGKAEAFGKLRSHVLLSDAK